MAVCPDVSQKYKDPSTGIIHNCSVFCDYEDPERSPLDCQEWCPELLQCLKKLQKQKGLILQTITPAAVRQQPEDIPPSISLYHVILFSAMALVMVLCVVIVVVISKKMTKQKRLFKRSLSDSEDTPPGYDITQAIERELLITMPSGGKSSRLSHRRSSSF